MSHSPQTPSRRLLESYAGRYRDRPPVILEAISLRLGDPAVRSVLTHMATDGMASYPGVTASFAATGSMPPTVPVARTNPEWLAALARVLALQDVRDDDRPTALAIYRYLQAQHGTGTFGRHHAKLYGDLLLLLGYDRELETLLTTDEVAESDRRFLVADLHNPWRDGPLATDQASWLRDFELASELCTEPLLRLGDHPIPFDRLGTDQSRPAVANGLVSVVMPVFRPSPSVRTSIESLLAQSWGDLELIVVDDGSGPGHHDLLKDVTSGDPRVRLVHLPRNVGTYAARNAGLSLARGRFVTFQDHDDWSHPRRLELQARPLVEDGSLVATHSRCARVDESLTFAHLGYHPLRHNASSLMIRRREVVLGVGYLDEVRKGADSEYHERIIAHFGRSSVDDLGNEPVLAAVRRLDDSLSRSDFRAGWHHPDRVWYRQSYRRWHARTPPGQLFIDRGAAPRRFTAPRSFHRQSAEPPELDVIVVSDWHPAAPGTHDLVAWCRERASAGAHVGVAHLDSVAHTTSEPPPLLPELVDLVHDETIAYVSLHEPATVHLALVALPSVLTFTQAVSDWDVDGIALLEDFETSVSTRPDGEFDRPLVTEAASLAFGAKAVWRSLRDRELELASLAPDI